MNGYGSFVSTSSDRDLERISHDVSALDSSDLGARPGRALHGLRQWWAQLVDTQKSLHAGHSLRHV